MLSQVTYNWVATILLFWYSAEVISIQQCYITEFKSCIIRVEFETFLSKKLSPIPAF